MAKYNAETTGVVASHRKPGFLEFQFMVKHDFSKGIASPGTQTWFVPIIRYEVDGRTYTHDSKAAYRGNKFLDVGQTVKVQYNGQSPEQCKICV